jgi:type II secretory pathway component PulF
VTPGVLALLRAFDDGRDRSEFYRGWRAGLGAGMSHPDILSRITMRGGITGAIRNHLLAGTRRREGLAALVRARPDLFEPFEAALLTMGEESGRLDTTLAALADFHHRQHKLILAMKKWLSYPMFVSLCAVVLLPIPLIFQDRMGTYWIATLGGLGSWLLGGGLVFARLAQRYQRRPAFVRARFARTLALCIGAGLPLGRALTLAADASGDPALGHHVRARGERALTTQPPSQTLAGTSVLSPELHAGLLVAEQTGDYASTLGRLADLYEDGFR